MALNACSTDLGLGLTPGGVPPELYSEFESIYLAIRKLAVALDKYTGNTPLDAGAYSQLGASAVRSATVNVTYVKAVEAIPMGRLVHLGGSGAVLAVADGFKMARGISLQAAAVDETVPVCLFGAIPLPGVTPGATYWLHAAYPGVLQNAPPTTGQFSQPVGYALEANILFINPQLVMELVP